MQFNPVDVLLAAIVLTGTATSWWRGFLFAGLDPDGRAGLPELA